MLAPDKFYESGPGDRLAVSSNHPQKIREFLQVEEKALDSIADSIDLLIEVGCMQGLHLDWAFAHEKSYLGIDIVKRYIQAGEKKVAQSGLSKERYRFIVGNGEEIGHLIHEQKLQAERERCLLFFPFNSFGNMQNVERVIASLRESELSFLISTYQTNDSATKSRDEYYKRCGYQDVRFTLTEQGVCFSSSDGLHSIAYQPDYLKKLFAEQNLSINITLTHPINIFYTRDIHSGLRLGEVTGT